MGAVCIPRAYNTSRRVKACFRAASSSRRSVPVSAPGKSRVIWEPTDWAVVPIRDPRGVALDRSPANVIMHIGPMTFA